jgi:hypothetical protein
MSLVGPRESDSAVRETAGADDGDGILADRVCRRRRRAHGPRERPPVDNPLLSGRKTPRRLVRLTVIIRMRP